MRTDSRYRLASHLTIAICVSATAVVSAHHSHPLFYDQCTSLTIEGRVARVQWKNPHSVIDVETDAGRTHHVEWMAAQAVASRMKGAQDALTVGARVVVIAHPAREEAAVRASFPDLKADLVPDTVDPIVMRRADDTFRWAPQPAATPADCRGN